jgi:hypothetical protein
MASSRDRRKYQIELGQHGTIADAKSFAGSILADGAGHGEIANRFRWNDIIPVHKTHLTWPKKH